MAGVIIQLWEGRPPYAEGDQIQDRPTLTVFPAALAVSTGSAMLIFPGGAYSFLSEKSGEQYARWLAEIGICGIVVNFRLGSHGYRYPAMLADARQAFRVAAANADRLNIDPGRIGVIGTSAGGHLASLLLTGAACERASDTSYSDARPGLGVLCYPVITLEDPLAHQETRQNFLGAKQDDPELQQQFSAQLRVSRATPPVFIWHTNTDTEVSAENTLLFAQALRAHSVPYELHLYGAGEHALGLARDQGLCWALDCARWFREHGF